MSYAIPTDFVEISNYKLITADSSERLGEDVAAMVDAGWLPCGGVSTCPQPGGATLFAQAIVWPEPFKRR